MHPVRVRQFLPGLNAEENILNLRIFFLEKMDVIGGNQWNTKPAGQVNYFRQDFFLVREAMVLDFEVKISFAKNLKILTGGGLSSIIHVLDQKIVDLALETTGKSN